MTNEIKKRTAPAPAQIRGIMVQMVFAKCISLAADLAIADYIGDGTKNIDTLAKDLNVNTNALHRLLRLLATHGIFQIHHSENTAPLVSNSAASELLKTNVAGSQRSFTRMMGSEWMWAVFNGLEYSLSTGNAAFNHAFPESDNLFQYFKNERPEDGKIFSEAMSRFSYGVDHIMAKAYDFSVFNNWVDIGGAEGGLLKLIKQQHPTLHLTLFDLPHAIEQARSASDAHLLNFMEGDFFDKIEPSSDGLIIKYCLHNWPDADCIRILKNCRRSITNNGRLLIMEMLIEPQGQQVFEKSLDIMMLLLLGGKERTAEEFENLFIQSGFHLNRVISTGCPLSILEVVPV
jgi:O-methyltransferase domain